MKLIEAKQAKEYADTYLPDPILRMAVNAVLDNCPEAKPVAYKLSPTEWIPVTERLPEQGQEVIVYDGGVLKPKVFAYHFWNKDFDSWTRITHWMPLPEPPKEVE